MAILGIDVGGTFTDAVLLEDGRLRTAKVPTARNQEDSVLEAAAAVGARELEPFTHGTTIATNALLERRGATTALVASKGFEHVLHLRRQDRPHLYRLCAAHAEPLVPLERSFGDEIVAAMDELVAYSERRGGPGSPRCPTVATRRVSCSRRPLASSSSAWRSRSRAMSWSSTSWARRPSTRGISTARLR